MATTLIVKTQFSAVDKFSSTIKKMTSSVRAFGAKTVAVMHKVDRSMRKVGKGIKNAIGKFGQLGLAVSGAAILMTVLAANVELDKSLASLQAITGATTEEFKGYQIQIDKVSKSQKKFTGDAAKAFEVVGSAQPELLKNAEALAKVTESSIILAKASDGKLAPAAQALTGIMNQAGLGVNDVTRAMNVLAAASVVGDTKISQTAEAFKVSGSEAKSSGLNIEELSGTIATFSKFGFKGAEAGTKFRNILSKLSLGEALPKDAIKRLKAAGVNINLLSDKTVPYIDRLKELQKIQGNSAALAKVFGEENKSVAAILLDNIPLLEQNIKGVTGTSAATDQAAIKSGTLANKWEELLASFKNTTTSTNSNNKALNLVKKTLGFLADNMEIIVPIVLGLTAAFIAFKVVMLIVNAVMFASPITWIVLGIIALIAAIASLVIWWEDIVKWVKESNSWFAKLIRFAITPIIILFKVLGVIISWISEKFSQLVEWVKTSDNWFAKFIRFSVEVLISFFQTLGNVMSWIGEKFGELINWVKTSDNWFAKFLRGTIEPLVLAFEKLGQLWDVVTGSSSATGAIKKAVDAELNVNANGENLNPDATIEQVRTNREEKTINNKLKIDITDQSGLAEVAENSGIDVNLTKTVGFKR